MSRHGRKNKFVQVSEGNNIHRVTAIANEWQGPLPDPASLEHYSSINPEVVKFIVESAREEQKFRHDLLKSDSERKDKITEAKTKEIELAGK
ncbi:MAG: hypothetical protein V4543_17605 [Bacteroidota bacterium]